MLKVIAFKNEDGSVASVVRPSKKEGWSMIQVGTETYTFNGVAYVKSSRRAFVRFPNELAEKLALRDGDDFNAKAKAHGLQALEIIRTESIAPAYEGHQPKMNPTTQEIIKDAEGNPIYMQDRAFPVGTKVDSLISASSTAVVAESAGAEGDLA